MSSNLLDSIPIIKRARFFYLYDIYGKRYLDFYVNNGKNFLGHRTKGLNLILKQTFSRGLTAPYPSIHKKQFEKMFFYYFKDAGDVLVFHNREQAKKFLFDLTGLNETKKPWEEKQGIYEFKLGFSNFDYPMLIELPLPSCLSLTVIVLSNTGEQKMGFKDNIDSFTFSSAKKVLSNIMTYSKDVKIDFNVFSNPLFKMQGRYMFPLYAEEQHVKVFNYALENGYLINPHYNEPSLAPFIFSKGDLDNFLKLIHLISSKLLI